MEHSEVSKTHPVQGMLPIYFGFHFSLDPQADVIFLSSSRTGAIIVLNVYMYVKKLMCNRHIHFNKKGDLAVHKQKIFASASFIEKRHDFIGILLRFSH